MPYIPLHERLGPGSLPPGPAYAPPDLDPTAPLPMSDNEDRPSKRRREDSPSAAHASSSHSANGSRSASAAGGSSSAPGRSAQRAPPPPTPIDYDTPIAPSIFGIAPRNEFTKTVGEFIMANCRGVQDVEIEIKLGMLNAPGDGPPRRVRLPTMTEMIIPPDYPYGSFASTMTQSQHASLNRLLNSTVESTARTPTPLRFFRAQHVDSFYNAGRAGKVRVSRDRSGNVVPGGVVRKRRLADLNVSSPREAFDWRVSCSVEDPAEMPEGEAMSVRDKDRACYRHQLCQVDLTVVTSKDRNLAPGQRGALSYELEIEVLDVPALVAEGEKEERGEPSRFDEMLQSVLDTARMLIRNV